MVATLPKNGKNRDQAPRKNGDGPQQPFENN
jgi:hypothetical protein